MKAITYCLRLLEPVLVSQAESGEENSAIGLPFIPGSALRGALVDRYLRAHPSADLAIDKQARHLFFDSAVCFLNAYPWREGARMLPRPMSWFAEKDVAGEHQGPVYDWAVDPDHPLEQPKPPSAGDFCYITDDSVVFYTPPRQVNVHISLEDPNRRGEQNKVYRYDALAEGEVLAGAIVAEDEAALQKLMLLLIPGELHLGGAHLAGYGRVKVEDVTVEPDWEEYTLGDDPGDRRIIVTLLSDAILRDANGQVNGDLDATVAAALGLPKLKHERAYQRVRLVGGFNRKWSLPLPQTFALQAGSVFVYLAGAFSPMRLRQVAGLGIGERRAEGFGRLAVNWHSQPVLQRRKSGADFLPAPALSSESKQLARDMAQRRLRLLLDRRLVGAVSDVTLKRLPESTQLSRVRNAVQQALVQGDLVPITRHLKDLKGARDQFERARVGTTPMFRWIEERVNMQDVETRLLRGDPLPEVAGQKAELTQALKVEYTGRLIDSVMKKAIKQKQRERKEVAA